MEYAPFLLPKSRSFVVQNHNLLQIPIVVNHDSSDSSVFPFDPHISILCIHDLHFFDSNLLLTIHSKTSMFTYGHNGVLPQMI